MSIVTVTAAVASPEESTASNVKLSEPEKFGVGV